MTSTPRHDETYWQSIWRRFRKHRLGMLGLYVVVLFCFVGVYAPFFASSKPIAILYDGEWYFPLFRYLFYRGFFTKRLDIFFNLFIFTLPVALLALFLLKGKMRFFSLIAIFLVQVLLFLHFAYATPIDPAANKQLNKERQLALKNHPIPSWNFDLKYMNDYARLNLILRYQQRWRQQQKLAHTHVESESLPTLWQLEYDHDTADILSLADQLIDPYNRAKVAYLLERRHWLQDQQKKIQFTLMPFVSHFHWEDDAGGGQRLNSVVGWLELTRINRKDLTAALIFGIRISLVVGLLAVGLSMAIGIPIGAFAGYYGGTLDIVVSRLLEIWESMPTFFMLLMVVAVAQSKSIFLVISVIGIFGWTGFSRYIRGEFFKQRNLPYVEACQALGFDDRFIIFSHILPNAIPPVLTLLPFAVMGAITSEAGLSFLGLGEEGSCSWGVLMDEGRAAFPGESYLLWPPAILLTTLLIAIALLGDALRDTLDPKLSK